MTALIQNRNNPRVGTGPVPVASSGVVAATTTVYGGALVGRDTSGTVRPATAISSLRIEGCASKVEQSYAAGETVNIDHGAFFFKNSTGDNALSAADIGNLCYAADDQTVSKTSQLGTLPPAGKVVAYDSSLGSPVGVEVGKSGLGNGTVQVESDFAFDDTDIDVAATSATRTLAANLPAGTLIQGAEGNTTVQWTDGAAGAFHLDLGDGTDDDEYAADLGALDSAASRTGAAIMLSLDAAGSLIATVTGDVNLSTLTAGATKVKVFLSLP